jgi:DNA repair protein SbcC/Rad50
LSSTECSNEPVKNRGPARGAAGAAPPPPGGAAGAPPAAGAGGGGGGAGPGRGAPAAAAGVQADDLDALVEALRRWQTERAAAQQQAHEARERWAGLQELLDGRELSAWEDDLARQRDQLPEPPAGVDVDLDGDLDAQLRRAEREAEAAQSEAKIAEGAVRTVEKSLPSVAEAEEDLARARAEEERVRRLSDTLSRTRGFLEGARDRVYRDVAPQLGAAVQRALPSVTAGRYAEARVDPETLLVRVRAPGGDWREATRLSHGTSEQIYLLLRMAMAEHLVTTGEPAPLLLDDVTTQSDPDRSRAILDLLHEVSAERQVVVFSQEESVAAWAREHLFEPRDRLELLEAVPAC